MKKTALAAPFFIALLMPHPMRMALGLTPPLGLNDELGTPVAAETFLQALLEMASRFKVPMGIEWVRSPLALHDVHFRLQRRKLRQAIGSLVATQRGYEWEVKGGVVHVFPQGALTDNTDFLNLRLDRFEARNEKLGDILQNLSDHVRPLVHPPPPPAAYDIGFGQSPYNPRLSLQMKKHTVREILDRLTLVTDLKIWVVTLPPERELTAAGYRRVVSLFAHDPGPEYFEGPWVMMAWGERLNACSLRPECVETPVANGLQH